MTTQPFVLRRCGIAAWVTSTRPRRLIASCRSRCFSWTSSTRPAIPIPAEFTSRSSPPSRATCSSTTRAQSSALETSAAIACAPKLGRRGLDLLGGAGRKRQGKSLVAEHPGDRQPDPGRAAGDERRSHGFRLFQKCQRSGCQDGEPGRKSQGSSSPLSATAAPRPPLRRLGVFCRHDGKPYVARDERWLRRQVLRRAPRGAAARVRARRGREPARRPLARRRRRRLQARRRARARLHARLLPAARRRSRSLRADRRDERAQRRLRDGRLAAPRALDRGLPGEPAERDARRDLRRSRRAGACGRRDPRRRPHAARRRAEVRARRRRHRAPGRVLAEERRATGRCALPDEAARDRDAPPRCARRAGGTRKGSRRRRGR